MVQNGFLCLKPRKNFYFNGIGKVKPDVVVMDLDLYAGIDGIKTSRMIRSRYDVPVLYV